MGVSIFVEWPGSTEEQQGGHPGLWQDDHMWACFLVECWGNSDAERALASVRAEVLLLHNTDGLEESEIGWATPQQYIDAARSLRLCIQQNDPRTTSLLALYAQEWDRIGDDASETAQGCFIQDLHDVEAISRYAQSNGAEKMTLGYYW